MRNCDENARWNRNRRWPLMVVFFFLTFSLVPTNATGQARRPRWVTKKVEPVASQSKPTAAKKKASSSVQGQHDAINLTANLVVVPVSVTDALGHPVSDLKTEDFLLEEDGRPQQVIALGEPGETPLELALLFDVSGSVHARFHFQQQAALQFLNQVYKPDNAVSIFSIGLEPNLVQPRTTDREAAMRGLITIEPTKEVTAFLDAVAEAAQYVGRTASPTDRRVLVVISDGEDTNSDTAHSMMCSACSSRTIASSTLSIRAGRRFA